MNQPLKDDGIRYVGTQNVKERLRHMCNSTVSVEGNPEKWGVKRLQFWSIYGTLVDIDLRYFN